MSNQPTPSRPDQDACKGAAESDLNKPTPATSSNTPADHLASQLGHRDQDELLKDNDSDFPEPGARAEHSGK